MQLNQYVTTANGANSLFAGTTSVMVDGLIIHEYRHVYSNQFAPNGQKWGASNDISGCRVSLCGGQALGLADIGAPEWFEKEFDFNNQKGISGLEDLRITEAAIPQ